MAPGFDDSPTINRPFGITSFESLFETSEDLRAGLKVMVFCVDTLFEARAQGKVKFAAGVTGKMLETMAILLHHASRLKGSKREETFQFWEKAGPSKLEELLNEVSTRKGKLLLPDDLSTFVDCPGGYEIDA